MGLFGIIFGYHQHAFSFMVDPYAILRVLVFYLQSQDTKMFPIEWVSIMGAKSTPYRGYGKSHDQQKQIAHTEN